VLWIDPKLVKLMVFDCSIFHRQLHIQFEEVIMPKTVFRMPVLLAIFTAVVTAFPAIRLSAQEQDAEQDAIALLQQMSAEIEKLDAFIVRGDGYTDARLSAGLIIETASEITMRVLKSGTVHLSNRTSEGAKEIFFGAGLLSIYSEKENFYAQTEIPEGMEAALNFVITELGLDAPLLDFLSGDTVNAMVVNADEVLHLGPSLVRGVSYEHVAIRTPETDVQIWIAAQGPPLPGKMSISSKWEAGSPRFVVFLNWETNPAFPAESLVFSPPPGAIRIEFDRTSVQ